MRTIICTTLFDAISIHSLKSWCLGSHNIYPFNSVIAYLFTYQSPPSTYARCIDGRDKPHIHGIVMARGYPRVKDSMATPPTCPRP